MSLRFLVLDFGNVVGFFSHRKAAEQLAALNGSEVDALHQFLFGGDLEAEYETQQLDTPAFLARLRARLETDVHDDELGERYSDIFWPNEPLIALLPELASRFPLYLLSNTNDLHARKFVAQFAAPLKHFRRLFLSHELRARKPERRVFELVQVEIGCRPEEILFVDDRLANIATARRCGWHTIHYTGQEALLAQLATFGIVLGDTHACLAASRL
jgi:putative hydrolase of the HAD superfamily